MAAPPPTVGYREMTVVPEFPPLVCVVGFHHARSDVGRSMEHIGGPTDDPPEARRSRAGLAARMAPTRPRTMTGRFSPSWPCPMVPMRMTKPPCPNPSRVDRSTARRKISPTSRSADVPRQRARQRRCSAYHVPGRWTRASS